MFQTVLQTATEISIIMEKTVVIHVNLKPIWTHTDAKSVFSRTSTTKNGINIIEQGVIRMRKKLMFVFSLLSLFGFLIGLNDANGYYSFDFALFFRIWIGFSLPLIIQFIYILIFRWEWFLAKRTRDRMACNFFILITSAPSLLVILTARCIFAGSVTITIR